VCTWVWPVPTHAQEKTIPCDTVPAAPRPYGTRWEDSPVADCACLALALKGRVPVVKFGATDGKRRHEKSITKIRQRSEVIPPPIHTPEKELTSGS
jgi:hypothetical protein